MEGLLGRVRGLGPLRSVPDPLLRALTAVSDPHPDRVQNGVVLFAVDDPTSCWYLLLSGQVQLYLTHQDGSVHPICSLSAGAIFGELNFPKHCCAARVTRASEFVRIPQQHFCSIYNKHADHLSPYIQVIQDMLADQTVYEPGISWTPMINGGIGGEMDLLEWPPSTSVPAFPVPTIEHQASIYDCQPSTSIAINESFGGYESQYENNPAFYKKRDQRRTMAFYRRNQNNFDNLPTDLRIDDANMIGLSNQVSFEARLVEVGCMLRHAMRLQKAHLICDHAHRAKVYSASMIGSEMVDWLLELSLSAGTNMSTMSRFQVTGMWQALLEYNIIAHTSGEQRFVDQMTFYRWNIEEWQRAIDREEEEAEPYGRDEEPGTPLPGEKAFFDAVTMHTTASVSTDELIAAILFLNTAGLDALFRMILTRAPHDRTPEELDLVYNELLHVKALAHLSTMVKRELASVIGIESHTHAGTVLYHQGDRAKCWYIILKGGVEVTIHGKGVVTHLREGDDFGKLCLVSDSPRATTVILRDEDSHFLIVDKHDFNRVLLEVEANTVRLKDRSDDVLVLERMTMMRGAAIADDSELQCCYSVLAGLAQKMIEYVLETRIDADDSNDTFLEDFVLTHTIYMPTNILCNFLRNYYIGKKKVIELDWNLRMIAKKRVIHFLAFWVDTLGLHFFLDPAGNAFIEELYCLLLEDCRLYQGLEDLVAQLAQVRITREAAMRVLARRPSIVLECGVYSSLSPAPSPVLPTDTCNQIIHLSDTTSFAMSIRLDRTAAEVVKLARQRMRNVVPPSERMRLIEVKSNGERIVFSPIDISVSTMLGLNSKLYVVAREEIHALMATPDQSGPLESVHSSMMEYLSSSELAQQLFVMHSEMFEATDETELVTQVFGRDQFPGKVPSNLDLLLRRFNEVQYWATTEVLLAAPQRRVATLRKFIKIAIYAKENRDLLSLFALTLGLSNIAVSRLNSLWNRLPAKLRRQFAEYEALLDPSRNHRAYRALVDSLHPPIVPFVPLLLKDLTFIHETNKTYFSGLVNQEKMHMVAGVLRAFRKCKAHFPHQVYAERKIGDTQNLIRNFRVIDNQRRLIELSYAIEPKRQRRH
ncbi:unnamed protein product, partial [Mesorhabditis belari]|uniref:Uncharacterized protein n=1 Tax=Mesorhabditis belari TaxID=2138241 RepID=A0AAF3J1S1_9BILA